MNKVISQDGKEAWLFTTPEGVTGIIATSVSMAAVNGLATKLEQRIEARDAMNEAAPPPMNPNEQ